MRINAYFLIYLCLKIVPSLFRHYIIIIVMSSTFIYTSICALTGILPSFLGLKRFNVINDRYKLFIFYLTIGFLVDVSGRLLLIGRLYESARILLNIYVLFEGLFFLVLFNKWKVIPNKSLFYSLSIFLILFWVGENFILGSIVNTNSLYRVIYSVITVLLSTQLFQQEYSTNTNYVFRDPYGIISATLIINYSYRAVFESLFVVQLGFSNDFYLSAFFIFIILNVFSNCTFTYAIHCMSLRKRLSSFY